MNDEVLSYCDMLNINPSELAPRSFEAFAEEGLPEAIQRLRHEHYEKKRVSKLLLIQKMKQRDLEAPGPSLNENQLYLSKENNVLFRQSKSAARTRSSYPSGIGSANASYYGSP